MKNNTIIVDLSKVQWARFGYRNQDGDWRHTPPIYSTVHNQSFIESELVYGSTLTAREYAVQNHLIDKWIPEVKLKVTANCTLTYTGQRAINLYKAFCERQFNPHKK